MISAKLIASLLVAISGYTGYAIPAASPDIITLPHAELAARVCGRPCEIMAFTTPDGRILLDETLRVGRDPGATSILVHELTHFLQVYAAHRGGLMGCREWNQREHEAYEVQFKWLHDRAPTVRVFSQEMARLGTRPILPAC